MQRLWPQIAVLTCVDPTTRLFSFIIFFSIFTQLINLNKTGSIFMNIKPREFLYIPNLLSLSRIVLIIPIFYLLSEPDGRHYWLLIILAVIAALTDTLDGFLSRRLNQVTELGILLDPLADKISMGLGFIALTLYRHFPLPILIYLLYRDFMIILISSIALKRIGKPHMPNFFGKANTTVLAVTGLLFLLNVPATYLNPLLILCYITIFVSGVSYAFVGVRLLEWQGAHRVLYWIFLVLLTGILIILTVKLRFLL